MSRGSRGPVGRAGRGPSGRAGGGPGRGSGCRKYIVASTVALLLAASVACTPRTHTPPQESPRPLMSGRQAAP